MQIQPLAIPQVNWALGSGLAAVNQANLGSDAYFLTDPLPLHQTAESRAFLPQIASWGANLFLGILSGGTAPLIEQFGCSAGDVPLLAMTALANFVTFGAATHFTAAWWYQDLGFSAALVHAGLQTFQGVFIAPFTEGRRALTDDTLSAGQRCVAALNATLGVLVFLPLARTFFVSRPKAVASAPKCVGETRGYQVWEGGVTNAPECLVTYGDYHNAAVVTAQRMGAKGVYGYGSLYMEKATTPFAEALKNRQGKIIRDPETGVIYVDKVADQFWVVDSLRDFHRAARREYGWSSYETLRNWAVHGATSLFGLAPRVSPIVAKAPVKALVGEAIEQVQLQQKVYVFTPEMLRLYTAPGFRKSLPFGAFENSVMLRMVKGMKRVFAVNEKAAVFLDQRLHDARVSAFQAALAKRHPRRPYGKDGNLTEGIRSMDLVEAIYAASYKAEGPRRHEGVLKVPKNLQEDAAIIPHNLAAPLAEAVAREKGRVVAYHVGADGRRTLLEPRDITPENFHAIEVYKHGMYKYWQPHPSGLMANASFLSTFLFGNAFFSQVFGLDIVAYANRKLANNGAIYNPQSRWVRMIPPLKKKAGQDYVLRKKVHMLEGLAYWATGIIRKGDA